jgi:hypothetical protein
VDNFTPVRNNKNPRRAALDLRDIPPEAYRLPSDGRQWLHLCSRRMHVADYLAQFANPDGSRITVGASRIGRKLHISRRTVQRILSDLVELGMMENGSLIGNFGQMTRCRNLNIQAILARSPEVAESALTVVPSSASTVVPSSPIVVSSSPSSCAIFASETLEDDTQPGFTVEPPKVKTRNDARTFVEPSLEEVKSYCQERNNAVDPETFLAYYQMAGWVVGKSRKPMKSWRPQSSIGNATVFRTSEKKNSPFRESRQFT